MSFEKMFRIVSAPCILYTVLMVSVLAVEVTANRQTPWIVTIHQRWSNSSGEMPVEEPCRGVVVDSSRVLTLTSCVRTGCPGVELVVESYCGVPDRRIINVTEHPTANLAILFVDVPFPINGSLVDFPDSGRKASNYSVASLDTTSGMQEVPLLQDDPCLNSRNTTPQDKLFIASKCDTVQGSPLFHHQNSNGTVLMGLVSSIPSNCNTTPCRIHLTDIFRYREWLATELRDQEPAPSIKLPKIPATVVFSFLKLLAVVSSLGGISFAFCCVMFLISN